LPQKSQETAMLLQSTPHNFFNPRTDLRREVLKSLNYRPRAR
jgi:hypothetical protein